MATGTTCTTTMADPPGSPPPAAADPSSPAHPDTLRRSTRGADPPSVLTESSVPFIHMHHQHVHAPSTPGAVEFANDVRPPLGGISNPPTGPASSNKYYNGVLGIYAPPPQRTAHHPSIVPSLAVAGTNPSPQSLPPTLWTHTECRGNVLGYGGDFEGAGELHLAAKRHLASTERLLAVLKRVHDQETALAALDGIPRAKAPAVNSAPATDGIRSTARGDLAECTKGGNDPEPTLACLFSGLDAYARQLGGVVDEAIADFAAIDDSVGRRLQQLEGNLPPTPASDIITLEAAAGFAATTAATTIQSSFRRLQAVQARIRRRKAAATILSLVRFRLTRRGDRSVGREGTDPSPSPSAPLTGTRWRVIPLVSNGTKRAPAFVPSAKRRRRRRRYRTRYRLDGSWGTMRSRRR